MALAGPEAIPPLPLVGWTMLQRATPFDAVFPDMPAVARTVSAGFLAVVLGAAATALAYKADLKQPQHYAANLFLRSTGLRSFQIAGYTTPNFAVERTRSARRSPRR